MQRAQTSGPKVDRTDRKIVTALAIQELIRKGILGRTHQAGHRPVPSEGLESIIPLPLREFILEQLGCIVGTVFFRSPLSLPGEVSVPLDTTTFLTEAAEALF